VVGWPVHKGTGEPGPEAGSAGHPDPQPATALSARASPPTVANRALGVSAVAGPAHALPDASVAAVDGGAVRGDAAGAWAPVGHVPGAAGGGRRLGRSDQEGVAMGVIDAAIDVVRLTSIRSGDRAHQSRLGHILKMPLIGLAALQGSTRPC
jgi:hypothetical protein